MSHPAQDLDEVVHQRTRLGILAVLAEAGRAQFGFIRDTLELTDGNLSRHLQILEEAGYVDTEKGYEGRRPRTWVRITRAGRKALAAELAALRSLADRLEASGAATERCHEELVCGIRLSRVLAVARSTSQDRVRWREHDRRTANECPRAVRTMTTQGHPCQEVFPQVRGHFPGIGCSPRLTLEAPDLPPRAIASGTEVARHFDILTISGAYG
jgi:DNA-binding MarR family transcriptional regulator